MKAYRDPKRESPLRFQEAAETTYYCDGCNTNHELGDYTAVTAIFNPQFFGQHNGIGHKCAGHNICTFVYIVADSGDEEQCWMCPNGCFHHDECVPDDDVDEDDQEGDVIGGTGEVWVCGSCDESQSEYGVLTSGDGYVREESAELAKEWAGECCL